MSDHTRAHEQLQFEFPENREVYAPWVAIHGLTAPYGECQCGCGQPAPIAKKTETKMGYVKGQPKKHIHGHNTRIYAPQGFKVCSTCRETKSHSEFYQERDGRLSGQCKKCSHETSRRWHFANRAANLERGRIYRLQNKEVLAAKERERRSDPDYREKCSVELKEWRERNKEYVAAYNRSIQVKARAAVNKAVLRGDLPHATTLVCAECEEAGAQQYHHYAGYERENWYKVIPLCTVCHGREHRKQE